MSNTPVSALQAHNAEIRPGSGYALPGPLRRRKNSFFVAESGSGCSGRGGWIGETFQDGNRLRRATAPLTH
ncbi:hypothetical protein [Erwinia psidii]|uniref:hypothetical protein n=1 Tax=Erwinia psidii TaxID=69224 RepID=UPI00226B6934|nr:hypothetical protein [Erwinia psidii]